MRNTRRKRMRNFSLPVLLMDMLLLVVSSLLAVLFVRWQTVPIFEFSRFVLHWIAGSVVASFIGLFVSRTYRVVLRFTSFRTIWRLAAASFLKGGLLLVFMLLSPIRSVEVRFMVILVVSDAVISLAMLVIARALILGVLESRSSSPSIKAASTSVLVFGTSDKSVSLLQRLELSENYDIVGFISKVPYLEGQVIQNKTIYVCRTEPGLRALASRLGATGVIFSNEKDYADEMDGIVYFCRLCGLDVLKAPGIELVQESLPHAGRARSGSQFIPDGMSSFERNTKRAVDLFLSMVLIIVFLPLGCLCALAIKREDGGPVIYKQERIGRFGRPFYIYKFRSMKMDAEAAGPALYAGDEDPRLTKVGKFLRQHHLDELPQLWNVFRGDMAFIGYRPERQFYIDQIMEVDDRYTFLYQIRPGVTSYATLRNGYTDSMDKMLRRLDFDIYYLRHRSWAFDIRILWLTFANIVFGKKF